MCVFWVIALSLLFLFVIVTVMKEVGVESIIHKQSSDRIGNDRIPYYGNLIAGAGRHINIIPPKEHIFIV